MALRNFMGAVNRPEPGLWITLAAIPANALLAYALIYGAFGLPRLDLLGAGLATTIVNVGMCLAAIWVCYARPPVPQIPRARALVARGLAIDETADRRRRADVRLVPARVRRVRRSRATDGLDRYRGAHRASGRAADRRRDVHGAVRHRHGGNRARRSRGGQGRCGGDAARGLFGDRTRECLSWRR
jgi:hypothetical protein